MWRVLLIGVLLLAGACNTGQRKEALPGNKDIMVESRDKIPEIKFTKTVHDFGKIYQGEVVGTYFSFNNTGSSNLLILDASASCGCTVPKWSKEPVAPGGEGTIEVMFDSSGREGMQNKSITIQTNASNANSVLYITAEVVTK
jgi:hypothetical protein